MELQLPVRLLMLLLLTFVLSDVSIIKKANTAILNVNGDEGGEVGEGEHHFCYRCCLLLLLLQPGCDGGGGSSSSIVV